MRQSVCLTTIKGWQSGCKCKVHSRNALVIQWKDIFIHTHHNEVKKFLNEFLNFFYTFTDSYIGFTLKMESVTKNTIFGLKMMMKSGLEKIILKSLHAGRWLFLLLNL